eukprot:11482876-Alexandrium_andersonii.AAC.1
MVFANSSSPPYVLENFPQAILQTPTSSPPPGTTTGKSAAACPAIPPSASGRGRSPALRSEDDEAPPSASG